MYMELVRSTEKVLLCVFSASQESSSVADVITGPSDFLPYLEVLLPHLTLLGAVLDIGEYTSAVMQDAGSPQEKCIKILSHWLKRTPNPTWRGFCQKLVKVNSFNRLRYRISTDRSTSENKLSSVPGSSGVCVCVCVCIHACVPVCVSACMWAGMQGQV